MILYYILKRVGIFVTVTKHIELLMLKYFIIILAWSFLILKKKKKIVVKNFFGL